MISEFILTGFDAFQMDPHGVFTGVIGAVLSLFVVNGNDFTLRRAGFTLLAGLSFCGYTIQYLDTLTDVRPLALIGNIGLGYLMTDLLSSIKTRAPTLTNSALDVALSFIKRFYPTLNKPKAEQPEDKPKENEL